MQFPFPFATTTNSSPFLGRLFVRIFSLPSRIFLAISRIRGSLNLDASRRRMVGYGQAVMDEVALIGPCYGTGGGRSPSKVPRRVGVPCFFVRRRKITTRKETKKKKFLPSRCKGRPPFVCFD
ncbi:hypothetical protein CDAR_472051 [Caerostris darwini]|uniref:Uncharacterized protein n=1 Tax=Caerostris darwini TaxID=1538125 RepID=A0AAV4VLD0_9ARAC|nr:hypothetical protein CDAR_472051 [Caerostris darwini]